jgi:hypothetical protein
MQPPLCHCPVMDSLSRHFMNVLTIPGFLPMITGQ